MNGDIIKEKIVYYTSGRVFEDGTNITMESVAKDLGISKKTLYKHFKNKTELINEVVNRLLDTVAKGFQTAFQSHDDPFVAMCAAFSMFANTYAPKLSKKLFEDIRKYEPKIWKNIDHFRMSKFKKYFPPVIIEGIKNKDLRSDINPEIVLLMYTASIQGIINPEILSQSSFSTKEAAKQIITTLFYGITTTQGKKKFDKYFKKFGEYR
jgi:AcrR family transcriptional regulator